MRKHLYVDEEPVRDDHDAGEDDRRGNWRPAEPTVDSIRGRRVHRLPRRDRAARVLARACSRRNDSACAVAVFIRRTCSTGSSAAHQLACRKPTAEEPTMKEE